MSDERAEAPAVEERVAARDAANWAKSVSKLNLSEVPDGAVSDNVKGRRLSSSIQGFGKMWQKTYQVRPVWHSSAIRSTLYTIRAPRSALRHLVKRERADD